MTPREQQSDEDFLRSMWPRLSGPEETLALAVRRMIGEFAGIDPQLIRSDATFDELQIGPADSIDEEDFVLRLETVLGRDLSRQERKRIPSPDLTSNLTIASFVLSLCSATREGRDEPRR